MDIFILYPIAWLLFMGLGILGYVITRKAASGYFLMQLLIVALVLFLLRDTFGAMDTSVWVMYAIGFASYVIAFVAGYASWKMEGVVTFQLLAFVITYLTLPWLFGFVGA